MAKWVQIELAEIWTVYQAGSSVHESTTQRVVGVVRAEETGSLRADHRVWDVSNLSRLSPSMAKTASSAVCGAERRVPRSSEETDCCEQPDERP